jgi:hypothetical protein
MHTLLHDTLDIGRRTGPRLVEGAVMQHGQFDGRYS